MLLCAFIVPDLGIRRWIAFYNDNLVTWERLYQWEPRYIVSHTSVYNSSTGRITTRRGYTKWKRAACEEGFSSSITDKLFTQLYSGIIWDKGSGFQISVNLRASIYSTLSGS